MPDIEEQIRRAIEEGKFANLAGKGKPLHLEDDPYSDPEWRLAYHMLRESGYSLPWLELRREIEADLEVATEAVERAWVWRIESLARGDPSQKVEAEWQRQAGRFRDQVEQLNRRIFDYNLQTPADRFQMRKLDPEKELERIRDGGRH
jgi:DnaJ family protein C protein 28